MQAALKQIDEQRYEAALIGKGIGRGEDKKVWFCVLWEEGEKLGSSERRGLMGKQIVRGI